MTSRRNFIKTVGATAAMSALYQHDLMADLIATSPSGRVLESKFKGMADIALTEAKTAGASYADIRFTMTATPYGGTAMFNADGGGRGGRFRRLRDRADDGDRLLRAGTGDRAPRRGRHVRFRVNREYACRQTCRFERHQPHSPR